MRCPSCGKVGERTKDNGMVKLETPVTEHEVDDDYEPVTEADLWPDEDLLDTDDCDDDPIDEDW